MRKLYEAWYGNIGIQRNEINKHYENFPQPKRGKLLKEQAHARLDADKKLLTEHLDSYLERRGKELCQSCGKNPAEDLHPCPFQSDVNDDHETMCNCCPDCEHNCLMDI